MIARLRALTLSVGLLSAIGAAYACSSFGEDEPTPASGGDAGTDATLDPSKTPVKIADKQEGVFDVLAVDGVVYWSTSKSIQRLGKDGPEFAVTGLNTVQGLASSNGFLFWANWFDGARAIMKLPLTGGPAVVVVNDSPASSWVAVDGESPFWSVSSLNVDTLPNRVRGASPDGGIVTDYATGGPGTSFSGPAIGGDHVYWVERSEKGRIMRAPFGGSAETFVDDQPGAENLTTDDTHCYWTVTNPTGAIFRAPLGGGPPEPIAQGLGDLGRIVNRGEMLYVHDLTAKSVLSIHKTTHAVATIADGQVNGIGINVDDAFVYWTARGDGGGDGTVWKAPR